MPLIRPVQRPICVGADQESHGIPSHVRFTEVLETFNEAPPLLRRGCFVFRDLADQRACLFLQFLLCIQLFLPLRSQVAVLRRPSLQRLIQIVQSVQEFLVLLRGPAVRLRVRLERPFVLPPFLFFRQTLKPVFIFRFLFRVQMAEDPEQRVRPAVPHLRLIQVLRHAFLKVDDGIMGLTVIQPK